MKYIPFLFLLLANTASAKSRLNLARRGKATQIDTYNELGAASNAIDGNRDSIYYSNSCTHTATTTDPWWRVDLLDSYVINSITIVNRGDCCQERLNGAEIRVGNSLLNNGNDNPIVARISYINSLQTFTMTEPVKGRYVNVFLPGNDKYLTLCEVEVIGSKESEPVIVQGVNLARRGKATHIDTYNELGAASNAIDGNRDSIYYSNSCTHTFTTTDPWWRVDLQDSYVINSITIVNRGDCCQERLNGAEIRVGNSLLNNGNDNPIVAKISYIDSLQTFTMTEPVKGRYVNVFLPGTDKYLTLCEVEVNGFKEAENVALRGEATQIDTYNELGAASNAIDGDRNSIYYSSSCSHTFTTANPWWRVDLLDTHIITSITITNRGDCCAERLDGAEIRAGNSLVNNGNDNPVVAKISHISAGHSETFSFPNPVKGRYVNVFLPGSQKYVVLCEVEIYGHQEEKVNVALHGEATQIDQYDELGAASNAIDGNQNPKYSDNSCSRTSKQSDPWWRVDLLQPHVITSISITNRGDCCGEMLDGAEIRIGNSLANEGNDNPVVANYSHSPGDAFKTFSFTKRVEGRYVNVVLRGADKYLSLCEVEVYGIPAKVNLALGGEATQIDTYDELGAASNAIDGNRDSAYANSSCSHTLTTSYPWWRVDLRDTYVVTSVVVTNRGDDCCYEEIDGAEIRVGSSLENNGNDNPLMVKIPRIPKGISQTFSSPKRLKGSYVNVFQRGKSKKLSLCEVEVYGYKERVIENVALRGDATHIDTYNYLGAASNAIDGKRDSIYYSNSCTHTFTTTDPWWRVDLLETHVITAITITNREDCCAQRLDGAEIRAGNSLVNNGNDNPVVAKVSHISAGFSRKFTLPQHVKARYVNVFLPGKNKYLTLCEVEVYGYQEERVNVARHGEAAQINQNDELGAASNAIDGNPSPNYDHGSCSLTSQQSNPWWRVDLLQPYVITSISITNRGDCCAEMLDGAQIRVGNSLVNEGNDNPVVANYSHTPEEGYKTFTFTKRLEGRYVNVFLPGSDKYLNLCEVEVYGFPAKVNVARGGEATQIDTYNELGAASNAIDGNRDSDYSHNSCSHTGTTSSPWWRVDLQEFYIVTSVTITNRRDCCHEEIHGAEIRVGNSIENDGNDNPLMARIGQFPKGISQTYVSPEPMKGRYVNVFLPGENKKLTLCEVEVYGYKDEGATAADERP